MDAKVDDFFNEINEIAPPKPSKKKECVWQQCYDELTGYSYYWNTKTDEVTWNTPSEFKSANKEGKKEKASSKKKELYVPPRAAPLFPSVNAKVVENSVKIYSIGENSKKNAPKKETRKPQKRPHRTDSESEDEKIELISSYGDDSESDSDEPETKVSKQARDKKLSDHNMSDEDDDMDILTKIQRRAKELKELGGDLPPEVKNIVSQSPAEINELSSPKEKKESSGFSLVAGYSDSEDEQENEEVKAILPTIPEAPKVSHSTLFPIAQPIDVNDFLQPTVPERASSPKSEFDTKAFQRKRRIGIALVNTVKKKEEAVESPGNERKGFGFSSEETNGNIKENIYPGFKKGGVMFVKTDVLNPSDVKKEEANENNEEEKSSIKREDVEVMYMTLKEKLGFLSEGRPVVSPVQVMVIQAETLFTAMKDGSLKLHYLRKWLEETCSELIQLEKDAAPEGWLLQWDRSHKRYYYQNQTTGEGQWEYPQPDVNRYDEAMDISTTPPPSEPTIQMSPPLPPVIRSPTPPPPPIISRDVEVEARPVIPDVPLLPEPTVPASKFANNGEPLPPGVDLPEIMSYVPTEKETTDSLYSALDSFYSEIAATETSKSDPSPPPVDETKQMETSTESTKKKKKSKVKLAPGLSMKKKGVSQLVEKWKNVQQHYND